MKAGDKLTVRVLDVDVARRRISLSARSAPKGNAKPAQTGGQRFSKPMRSAPRPTSTFSNNPFAGL